MPGSSGESGSTRAQEANGGAGRTPTVAIIGAGMSGLLTAIKLKEAGINSFPIHEKSPELGGTWWENTYPGLACDVPSRFYSYSFEPNPEYDEIRQAMPSTIWVTGCKSWYLAKDGLPNVWTWLPGRHRELLAEPVDSDFVISADVGLI